MKHKIVDWTTDLRAGDFIPYNDRYHEIYAIGDEGLLLSNLQWICASKIWNQKVECTFNYSI